jgi:hypothetical protein
MTDPRPVATVDGIDYAPGGAYATCVGKAANVREYVEAYANQIDPGEDIDVVLADLLADLQHYAAIVGVDWQSLLSTAAANVEAERRGE